MKTVKNTLLIHTDTKSLKTESLVVDEKTLVEKTKKFLHKLSKQYKEAKIEICTPIGIILQSPDKKKNYAVAYEQERFVIVAPNGTSEEALLYGNWDEALKFTEKLLTEHKEVKVMLAQYQD